MVNKNPLLLGLSIFPEKIKLACFGASGAQAKNKILKNRTANFFIVLIFILKVQKKIPANIGFIKK